MLKSKYLLVNSRFIISVFYFSFFLFIIIIVVIVVVVTSSSEALFDFGHCLLANPSSLAIFEKHYRISSNVSISILFLINCYRSLQLFEKCVGAVHLTASRRNMFKQRIQQLILHFELCFCHTTKYFCLFLPFFFSCRSYVLLSSLAFYMFSFERMKNIASRFGLFVCVCRFSG